MTQGNQADQMWQDLGSQSGSFPPLANSAYSAEQQRVTRQQSALLEFMRGGMLARDLPEIFSILTEIAAQTLNVARVSIWKFNATHDAIRAVDLYIAPSAVHASGDELQASRYPAYFAALRNNRVISAPDVERDPRVMEFSEHYLQPLRIHSMLDSAIWHGGATQGVVCVESVDERREWTLDEQQFVGSIADLVALAIENESRRQAQSRAAAYEQHFAQVFRLIPDWLVITRISDGVVLEVNDSFHRETGYRPDEVIGRTTREFGLWAISQQRERWLQRILEDGLVHGLEADLRLKSGDIHNFYISTEPIAFKGQACLISALRDITESKRNARLVFDIAQGVAADTGEAFFVSLVESIIVALGADLAYIGEINIDDQTEVVTLAAQQADGPALLHRYSILGSPAETVIGSGLCVFPRDVATLFPQCVPLVERKMEAYVGAPLYDANGQRIGVIAVMFQRPLDSCEMASHLIRIFAVRAAAELVRRRQNTELERRASHDMLTGLQNRAALEKKMDAALTEGGGRLFGALLLLDLDRFKEINDTLGHAVGDSMLVMIAARLLSAHESNVIGNIEVARISGDEFAIWPRSLHDMRVAQEIATQVLGSMAQPFEIEGYRLEVGARIGIALYPAHGKTAAELLRCADIAMHLAKQQGSGFGIYELSDDPYSPARLTLMSQLSDAIRNDELELHYQPRLHLADLRPAGFEALVRWRHPQLGLLPPGQFIPLAELSDVIRPLTIWVIEKALTQLRLWQEQEIRVVVAVNISARHLIDDAFPDELERLLRKHHIKPSQLELEITESAIIIDPERATKILERIHQMGLHISIDDFGTGYSSLSHLRRLPLNALKIDVSFVTHMLSNEQDALIVESTIGLAHNLGLSVVAEGIEDAETQAHLRELGCDEGQGYFIARPLERDAATAWVREQCRIADASAKSARNP